VPDFKYRRESQCQFITNCPSWLCLFDFLEEPTLHITVNTNLLILQVSGFLLMLPNMLTLILVERTIQTQLSRVVFCLLLPYGESSKMLPFKTLTFLHFSNDQAYWIYTLFKV